MAGFQPRGGGKEKNFDLDNLISKLESLKTLIVYDSLYASRSLLFHHILPQFSSKNIFIAVYSDTMYRRLEKTYESILKTSPEVKKILEGARIIKIGTKKEISFGQLYKLVSGPSWLKPLTNIVRELSSKDLLLLHGFSIIPVMYGQKGLRDVLRLLDSAHGDITVIGKCSEKLYSENTEKLLERFYDVVLEIKRTKGEFPGFEETYTVGVRQSILMDIRPGFGRFKIGDDGRLVEF